MGVTLAAVGTALAIIIPLLDQAIKDNNNKKVKYYQGQISKLQKEYNLTVSQLNNAINKFANRYSDAVSSVQGTVRGSTANKVDRGIIKQAREGIKSTQSELQKKSRQYEEAIDTVNAVERKYENKGIIETVSGWLGNK